MAYSPVIWDDTKYDKKSNNERPGCLHLKEANKMFGCLGLGLLQRKPLAPWDCFADC